MDGLEPWQVLAICGFVLASAEVFTPSFVSLPAGLAFLATAVVALFVHDGTILSAVLALHLALVYALFHRFVWPRLVRQTSKTTAEAMDGKLATVVEAVDPKTDTGSVKLYGDTWRVISQEVFPVGSHVLITGTDGNKVIIEAAPIATNN